MKNGYYADGERVGRDGQGNYEATKGERSRCGDSCQGTVCGC